MGVIGLCLGIWAFIMLCVRVMKRKNKDCDDSDRKQMEDSIADTIHLRNEQHVEMENVQPYICDEYEDEGATQIEQNIFNGATPRLEVSSTKYERVNQGVV